MTLSTLQSELARLLYSNPQAATNVESVSNNGTDIHFETDVSGLREEIAELTKTNGELEKEIGEAIAEKDEAETKCEEALQLLSEFKDDGLTVPQYKERVETAELDAKTARELSRRWQHAKEAAERECDAMRRKNGVDAGYFGERAEVLAILNQFSQYGHNPMNAAKLKERASAVLAKIHAK